MKNKSSRDIAELIKAVGELQAENEHLRKFIDIEKKIGIERSFNQLLPLIITEISQFLNADRSTLFLLDFDRMELWTKFAEDLEVDKIRIKLRMGIVGLCVLTKRLVNVANAYEDPRFNPDVDEITGFKTESIIAAPLYFKNSRIIGAMELLNKKAGFFTVEDEKRVQKKISALNETDFTITPDRDKAKALIDELCESTRCERGSVFLINNDKGELYSIATIGHEGKDIRLHLNLGIAGLVAITGQTLNIDDAYADPRFDRSTDEKTGYRTRCILCVPVKNQAGEVLGVIQAINKKDTNFSDSDEDHLMALSSSVAISLENAILFQQQHRQFKSILEVMAASIDARDPLTAGHSQKVTQYAVGIAGELGFKETEIDILSVAALLHDYGKIGIDDHILKKQGKLSHLEYEQVKQHVAITRKILDKMYFTRKYRSVAKIASCHHERLDGSGYYGLKSQDIPFMSKIIAVADVFEALTAKRYYHKALSPELAFAIIEKDIGTTFDENIVTALKKYLIDRGVLNWP
ncbi:MAG: GAF domain-containing protein [Thermodesulfobacteriota bacterium]|nr:GAF domain-containing protein [Thermodesulfobacteriota bacterium]